MSDGYMINQGIREGCTELAKAIQEIAKAISTTSESNCSHSWAAPKVEYFEVSGDRPDNEITLLCQRCTKCGLVSKIDYI